MQTTVVDPISDAAAALIFVLFVGTGVLLLLAPGWVVRWKVRTMLFPTRDPLLNPASTTALWFWRGTGGVILLLGLYGLFVTLL